MAESDLLYSELTRDIIGAAMEVHKILSAGFAEYERQKPINIIYKGRFAKQFICDFMVYDKIIVELKAIKAISDIETAQLLNYLKGTDLNLGLLLNFGASSLEYKRMINTIPRNL